MSPDACRDLLEEAFRAAVAAAMPDNILTPHLPSRPRGRLVVIGVGKAAASMAQAVEAHYGDRVEGAVITRYGHALPTHSIDVLTAGHPVPDTAGEVATERLLGLLADLGEDVLVLILLAGGGSTLLTAPDGIALEQKADLTQSLLRCGADIHEMNCVRKHLSRVKGGRLAVAAHPARVLTLVISDVVGDDLSVIASGPTVADPTTFGDALDILDRYDLVAPEVRRRFIQGIRGELPETLKPGDSLFDNCETKLVATNQSSLEAAANRFAAAGVRAHILSAEVTGEARAAGGVHAAIVRQILTQGQPFRPPCALLSGGETTVRVRGCGRGGRNGEFALGLALNLPPYAPTFALAADSDGVDGSEDNAGAWVTPDLFRTVPRDRARRLLEDNDSYTLFEEAGHLLFTGPTHTNVNDLRFVLVLGN